MKIFCNKDFLLAALAGLLLLLSTPGFNLWPLAFVAFAVMAWVFDRAKISPVKAAFLAGFIYYTIGISWIHVPVTFFGGAPMPAGVALVIFTGLVGAVMWVPYGYVAGKLKLPVAGALVFIAVEMLKGKYLFGGLPWLNVGQTQYNNAALLQIVSVVGEHGLSLLVVLSGYMGYRVVRFRNKKEACALAAVLLIAFGFGFGRLALNNVQETAYTGRMVQTGIDQADKWDRSKRAEILTALKQRALEAARASGDYDILIFPESTFTANPFRAGDVNAVVRAISADHPIMLSYDRGIRLDNETRLYNSSAIIRNGQILQNYDKMKLAPFGEYFPLEKILYPLRKFFFGDSLLFTPGAVPTVFDVGEELKIIPLICFEGAFSEIIRERVLMGGNVIFLVSNDSWFGESLGRIQNLAINAVRAAEYNRYILRVTQDGISALIGPDGKIPLRLEEKVFAYADVQFAPIDKNTVFAKLGYTWYVVFLMGYGIVLLKKRRRVID